MNPCEASLVPADEPPASEKGAHRDDLSEALERRRLTRDEARPDAVERRHAGGARTARENLEDLVDPGSFVEYGGLAIAAQRRRRELRELIERTPADGLVAGTARVNGDLFDEEASACAVLSYDYMVLTGTQGALGHKKKDRLFELDDVIDPAETWRLIGSTLAAATAGVPPAPAHRFVDTW